MQQSGPILAARRPLLYSIGHSNHTAERFIQLLQQHGIEAVADVRSAPYSRFNPHFSKERLEAELRNRGFYYVFLGRELGARREEPECYRDGRVDFGLVVRSTLFQRGVARLTDGASRMKVAMMCAEKDPLSCHRTLLIARHIIHSLSDIHHILADGEIETHGQLEQRLLQQTNLDQDELFATRAQRIEEAYCRLPGAGERRADSSQASQDATGRRIAASGKDAS